MRKGWMLVISGILAIGIFDQCPAQDAVKKTDAIAVKKVCECGAHPPGPPRDRIVTPYAGTPDDLKPFGKFTSSYDVNYVKPNIYMGAARKIPDPTNITEVRVGFIGPIEHTTDQVFGLRMLHGAQMAIDEANARGGYGGKPFKLMVHNDYNNWQRGAVYGEDRPTDPTIWGSPSDEAVKMIYDDEDWAIFGSISSETTHIVLRVALRAEIPVVNSENTDPTVPETTIPWYIGVLQDDRQQSYTLARHIFTELGLKRVALFRINNRYGRFGVGKFRDATRRLGHPLVIEQKYLPGDTDYSQQLKVIRDARADAIVVWADENQTALFLKQLRDAGMKQRVFGAYRTLGPTLLAKAEDAAEGFEAVYPYDPTHNDPQWIDFNKRYEDRFHEKPDHFGALAFDAMNTLLDSICKAGLNRARIHDALANIEEYDGVTGHMTFDPNGKNVAPMYLGTVHNGTITYRVATMEAVAAQSVSSAPPQASAAELQAPQESHARASVDRTNDGSQQKNSSAGPVSIVLFGAKAAMIAASPEMQAELESNAIKGHAFKLLPVENDQNIGAATTALVHALMDDHALAILALDKDASHLAEQMALKSFVPVVELAAEKASVSTNIPWSFLLQPGTTPATALRMLVAAECRSGANSERLRDVLASEKEISGGEVLHTGEQRAQKNNQVLGLTK
jgi:ABC-type branched-subunit amino acid transport system substrate-binding protein